MIVCSSTQPAQHSRSVMSCGEKELLDIHWMSWNVSPVGKGTWYAYLAASVLKAGQRKWAVGGCCLLKTLLLNPLAFSLQPHST